MGGSSDGGRGTQSLDIQGPQTLMRVIPGIYQLKLFLVFNLDLPISVSPSVNCGPNQSQLSRTIR